MKQQDTMTPKVLAYLLVAALIGLSVGLFIWEVPTSNKEAFGTILQTLLTLAAAAVFFHVGSSSGSRNKDKPALDPEGGPIRTNQTETTTTTTAMQQEAKP